MNRRTVAAACLVASPVLHVISYFLWPAHSEGTHAQQLQAAAAHSGAWAAATGVETVGWLLLLPALVVLWHEVRDRGRTLTGIGVWISVLGVVGFYGAGVMNAVTIALARLGTPTALTVFDALHADTGLVLTVIAMIMFGMLGFVVLAAGLARAGLVGWWAPAAALVAVIGDQVLSESENPLVLTLAFAPMAAVWLALAPRLLPRSRRDVVQGAGLPQSVSA